MPVERKKIALWILTFLLIAVIAVAGYRWWKIANYHFDDRTFNRKVWLANINNSERRNPRGLMVDDLKNTWLKKGITREDVVKLLGKPDPPEPEKVRIIKDGIEYGIGSWSGCSFCPDVLAIYFDRSDHLVSVEVTEH